MPITMKARPGKRSVSYFADTSPRAPSPTLATITVYIARERITATAFGVRAAGDPRLVFDMRKGRQVHPRLAARLHAYMAGGAA